MRYCLEYLTKRPSGYASQINQKILGHNGSLSLHVDLGVDFEKPYIIKSHGESLPKDSSGYLIFLIRNYKEVIVRHSKGRQKEINEDTYISYLQGYVHLTHLFDNWPSEKKALVYYEDLIEFPYQTFLKLTDFMNEGKENILPLYNELNRHKQNAIDIYNEVAAGSHTRGELKIFHSEELTEDQKHFMDTIILEKTSTSFREKYLTRYFEK